MSEIDKLINQAFPDELRDVEPIDVDEDAILSMTLEQLGLEPPEKQEALELPVRPLGRRRRSRDKGDGPELVEVPVVVHHRWVDWAGWAIAACLVLVCAVNWGPWLINNLDFGIGPRSQGDMVSPESSGGGRLAEYVTEPMPDVTVSLEEVSYSGPETITITLKFRGNTPWDMDEFDIKVSGTGSETVTKTGRSSQGSEVSVTCELNGSRKLLVKVGRMVSAELDDGNTAYVLQELDTMVLDLNIGQATSRRWDSLINFTPYFAGTE